MSYTKQGFRSGDILYASQLNAIDDQVEQNEIDITTLKSQVANLMYKPIEVTLFRVRPNTAEMGSTVNAVTLTYGLNKAPTSNTLDGTTIPPLEEPGGELAKTGLSLTSNKTWTLVATDERSATSTKTAELSFLNRVYYGADEAPGVINSAFLLGLDNGDLSGSKGRTFDVTVGTGEYIWYAVPTRMGACTFMVGGFEGGFTKVSTFSHTNASGYSENYDVYRSDNAALGAVTVKVS